MFHHRLERVTSCIKSSLLRLFVVLSSAGFLVGSAVFVQPARAQQPITLQFQTHAAFFSQETGRTKAIDPQVFVPEADAPASTGPQNIKLIAGFRTALITDAPDRELFSAAGRPLGFTLGKWLGATGEVILAPMPSGAERVIAVFTGLKPGGVYSLFENHFDQKPIGFTPLDGQGTGNSFVAGNDGRGAVTLVVPHQLTNDNAVLLVYHSDGKSYGTSRGEIGVIAHHHLIAPFKLAAGADRIR